MAEIVLVGTHRAVTEALKFWASQHSGDAGRCEEVIDGIAAGRVWVTEQPAQRGFDPMTDGGPDHALICRALELAKSRVAFLSPEWSEYEHKREKFYAGALVLEWFQADG